jgi:AraC-like DNA-binding protein
MLHFHHIPEPPLFALVECLWYWEGAPATHARERLLPNGTSAIIVNLRDESLRIYDARDTTRYNSYGHAVLSGARSDCVVVDTNQQERVFGIQFRPGGAFPFFRMPASQAEGASIALEDLWSARVVGDIREQLLAAPAVDAMFAIVERCLLAHLVRPPELHPAVAYALRRFCRGSAGHRIADVTERIGLSPRRFIELFHRQVGLTPKTFSRVRRFQQALQSVHGRREIDWARVALDNGYYDQAHFIHDFQAFSGFTPKVYAALATAHQNHVPLR